MKIVDFYTVDVGDKRIKENVMANLKATLFKTKVLQVAMGPMTFAQLKTFVSLHGLLFML